MSSIIKINELQNQQVCEEKNEIQKSTTNHDYVQQQETTKSLAERLMIRGKCAFSLGCTSLCILPIVLLVVGIQYLIYVYAFNSGDWSPTCNNCTGVGIAILSIFIFGPPLLTLIGYIVFVNVLSSSLS